ncbi:MAG: hypothetical protein ACRC0V_01685 [Fusobacteriaceae bacterium]
MSKQLTAIEKMKLQLKEKEELYVSTFDFASCEIEDDEINILKEKEVSLFKNFKSHSTSLYEMCKIVAEFNMVLKKEGKFVEWYKHVGLNKDKVSELMKRYEIYMAIPSKYNDWVSTLSIQAVKLLTKKEIMNDELILEAATLGLKSMDDLNYWISNSGLIEQKLVVDDVEVQESAGHNVILDKFRTLKSEIITMKNSENISQYKNEIRTLKKEIEEFENSLKEEEEKEINKNNLKLFNSSQNTDLKLGEIIQVMFPDKIVKELIVCKRTQEDSCFGKCDLYELYSEHGVMCHDLLRERQCGLGGKDKEICFKYKNKKTHI